MHLIDALALGGAERMLVEIANATVDSHRTSVCVTRSRTDLARRLDERVEVLVLHRRRRFELAPLLVLAAWCRDHEVDLVHCHGRSSFSLAAALRALRLIKKPIILHDHRGIELDATIPRWFRVATRYMAHYVAVYPKQVSWARRAGVVPKRIEMIPNAIDMRSARAQKLSGPPLPDSGTAARVIAIGGIRREKAFDVLLEAIALVRYPIVLYILGGDADADYARRCRERASRVDLRGRVVFVGPREDALAVAATADLAVHSSRSESGPLVLLEYAAHGLPLVSTRVGGIAAALADAGGGVFVEPDDIVGLANAIEHVAMMSSGDRSRLGESLRAAASSFDIDAVMPAWFALYSRVLDANS